MKYLGLLSNDKVELEVIECDCGFHIGVDATYLDQVTDVSIICPSCCEYIYTQDLVKD